MTNFIVLVTYVRPMEEVDAVLDAHVEWLQAGHKSGHFLGWARKVPRDGGLIFARGADRAEIEALAATDPFITSGVAKAEVIEWAAGFIDPSLPGFSA